MAHRTTGGVPREVLQEREAQAWNLRQKLYTHQRIADELGVERSTVTKTLLRLSARANKQLVDLVTEQKLAQLEQLSYMADEAMQAWHRSKEAQRSVGKRTVTQPASGLRKAGAPHEEMTVQTEDQDGNARYLDAARAALGDIRKLLSLETQRTEISGPEGGPVRVATETLTEDERTERVMALLDRARARRDGQAATELPGA